MDSKTRKIFFAKSDIVSKKDTVMELEDKIKELEDKIEELGEELEELDFGSYSYDVISSEQMFACLELDELQKELIKIG